MPTLFDPLVLGALKASNRAIMAPLTRARATRGHVPTALMAEYYAQRASAGLIIGEATGISSQGLGWIYAPGLWSDEQTAAWKPVTQAVHRNGGLIIAQLWHMGRMAHSAVTGERYHQARRPCRGKRIPMMAKSRLKLPAHSQWMRFRASSPTMSMPRVMQ